MLAITTGARRTVWGGAVVASLLSASWLTAQQSPPPTTPPQTPTIIASTTLVPVDVRVVDHSGKPVTDLKATDFTVFDNGVKQNIQHFEAHAIVPTAPAPGVSVPRVGAGSAVTAQDHRVFLLLVGRGFQQPVSKAYDGAIAFVKGLQPQDYVAVQAWNRATDFTTDHDKILHLLEGIKREEQGIEAALRFAETGLAGVFMSETPPEIQARIDQVFDAPDVPVPHTLASDTPADVANMAAAERQAAMALLAGEVVSGRDPSTLSAKMESPPASAEGASFDQFVAISKQGQQDLDHLYAAIEYLRFVEGEKHVVFFSEQGLFVPDLDNDRSLCAHASDARVAIDTIQTGGAPAYDPKDFNHVSSGFLASWAIQSLSTIAELTGGQASAYAYAEKALTSIDRATTFEYLLGYYPPKTSPDGTYHQITVKVNRRGTDVLYRRGYYAGAETKPMSRREMMANARVSAAVGVPTDIHDLELTIGSVSAHADPKDKKVHSLSIDLHVDLSRVGFATDGSQHVASLEVAVFCDNPKWTSQVMALASAQMQAQQVSQMVLPAPLLTDERLWRTVPLSYPDFAFTAALRDGLSLTLDVPVETMPNVLRIIVYDAGADLLGVKTVPVKLGK